MRKQKRQLWYFALLSICLLLLTACGKTEDSQATTAGEMSSAAAGNGAETVPDQKQAASEPVSEASENAPSSDGNILVMGAARDLKNGFGQEGQYLVFDTMTALDERQNVLPKVIESWDVNEDATEYVLHIRDGVNFTDGTKVTSEIVKYSLEAYGPYKDGGFLNHLAGITVEDELTLTVAFEDPYGNFPLELSGLFVLPIDSVDDTGNITVWTGTGQFILEEYQADQGAVLKANKEYWDKDRIPGIDGIRFVVIPDANARIMALQSGEVDVLGVTECFNTYPYSSISDLMEDENFMVISNKDSALVQMYGYNYKEGLMSDIHLREAVTCSIDRDTIAETFLFGLGKGCGDFLPRVYQYSTAKEEEYAYDLERAKEALKKGGYEDTDGDGIVEHDGEPVKLRFVIQSGATPEAIAVFVQEGFRQIGIDSELTVLDSSAFYEVAAAGEYDICYTHPWMEPQKTMLWRTLKGEYDKFGLDFGINDRMEAYRDEMLSKTEPEDIQAVFDKIWAELYPYYPATGLYTGPRVYMYKSNITGFVFNPDRSYIDLSDVVIR